MESDEALARRLQQEAYEEAARYTTDAAYARSVQLTLQLGLPLTPQKKKKKMQNKNKNINQNKSRLVVAPAAGGQDRRPTTPTAKANKNGQEVVVVEEDERIEHLMKCLRKLAPRRKRHEDEYTPDELFKAVRWAFGPTDYTGDASPPVHVANCQRLVEAWRSARLAEAALDQAQAAKAEAMVVEFRAWLEVHERGQHSEWERLPLEVMEMIFAWFPADEPQHLLATRLVCRAWHRVTSDANQSFWHRLFVAHRDRWWHRQETEEKEARRQEFHKLLRIARQQDERQGHDGSKRVAVAKDEEDDEEGGEEVCWKRQYYELLHGVDASAWEEVRLKGFRTRLINGPKPGKTRPNYVRTARAASCEPAGHNRRVLIDRERRRERSTRSQTPF